MLPRTLKNFDLYVDARGYAGRVAEVNLPKLSRVMENFRGGGMNAELDIDLGMEKLEGDLVVREWTPELITTFGICDPAGVGLRFMGATASDSAGCATSAIEVSMRGRFKTLDWGKAEPGKLTEFKLEFSLNYFKYIRDQAVLIEIDILNMIEIVNGVDRLAQQRAALGYLQ